MSLSDAALDAIVEQIVERVLLRLADRQRVALQKAREAKIADLRAFEDMHGLPRTIQTWAERNEGKTRGGRAELDTGHHDR